MSDDRSKVTNQARLRVEREAQQNARRARKQKALKRRNSNRKRG